MSYQSISFFLLKALLSGVMIALISTMAKTLPKLAALLTALPLLTILSLIWIYIETKDMALLSSYTKDVLIWVMPSLLFFVAALYLFKYQVPFYLSILLSIAAMGVGVLIFEKMNLLK